MNRGISIWIDVLRVVATFVVVVSHWGYPRFTEGRYMLVRDWNLGSDAVIVFFVISGCVIAYAAARDGDARRFAFNRLTRLWTVLVPALILTLVFDAGGNRIDPSAYPLGFYNPIPAYEVLVRGVTFSNQWSLFEHVRLGTNGPLWSLSYEAAYYAMFGVAVFARSFLRLIILAGMCVIFGWNVLLLIPAWLMGVALWQMMKRKVPDNLSVSTALVFALGTPAIYILAHIIQVPEYLLALTRQILHVPDARLVLSFSDEFLWNGLIGLLTLGHFLGMARLLPTEFSGSRSIRWLAGASFSIYVTHYPALHLLDAMLGDVAGRDAMMLTGSICVGLVFASVFERPIGLFRSWLLPRTLLQSDSGNPNGTRRSQTS